MKFPLSWLKEFIPTDLSPEKISEILTLSGIEVDGVHAKENDFIFEVSMTPNFGHALSILGIARELAAFLKKEIVLPKIKLNEEGPLLSEKISIQNKEKELAPRYLASAIFDVDASKKTPDWMAFRLEASGFRSINVVVDCVNYVLMELGAPLHAFDYNSIKGASLEIRKAKKSEKIVTLDHIERFLSDDMLIIADSEGPIAIAGCMGGLLSEVTDKSRAVLLEGAFFDAKSIRRTSKHLELFTEASRRFERGVDPDVIEFALDRAARLIQEYAGGQIAKGKVTLGKTTPPLILELRPSEIKRIVGISISQGEIEELLKRLGFHVSQGNNLLSVTVPSYRPDVKAEIDLIEEVARIYGYNNIYKRAKKPFYRNSTVATNPLYDFQKKVVSHLLQEGLTELVTCDLINEKKARDALEDLPGRSLVKVMNPHSQEESALRPSLLPNHLAVVLHNRDHGINSIAGFEIGRIHIKEKDRFLEPFMIGISLSGQKTPSHFDRKAEDFDFLDLKGILENLFNALKIEAIRFASSNHSSFHPGKQAKIILQNAEIGVMGEVHPDLTAESKKAKPLFFAELSLEEMAGKAEKNIKMKKLPLFPSSGRDLTLTVKEEVPIQELLDAIRSEPLKFLESLSLTSIFRSDKIGANWKNVTLHFVFRNEMETISQSMVEEEMAKLLAKMLSLLENKIKVSS